MSPDTCPICLKHRGEGPLIGPLVYEDDLVLVSHRATGGLGYVFLETRRHVAYLDSLTPDEAARVGRVRSRLALGLRAELDLEFVHTMVTGRGVSHFHEHVLGRYADTPSDTPWWELSSTAPQGDVAAFARRLGAYVDSSRVR